MAVANLNPKLLAYRIDPPSLMRAVGMEPDPWQERLLLTDARRILVLSTRQAGKSTTTAALGLRTILTVPRSLVVMVSASHDQSKELFLKLADMYEQIGRPLKPVKQNTSELRLSNGGRVLSLPSNPKTIRGYSKAHTIICDEAALMVDEMFTAVAPMRAVSGGRLVLISSPKGQRGYFWDQWETGGETWERYRVTADDCPRITDEFLDGERRTMRDAEYQQEYYCRFVQADDQFFDTAAIDRAFTNQANPYVTEAI